MDKRVFADKKILSQAKQKKSEYNYHSYKEFDLEGFLFYEENDGKLYRLPKKILNSFSENMQEIAKKLIRRGLEIQN
ncbi:MAG: hypothetical protein L6V93_01980 [Clostridiales bacterium]|nr:MAG: hypothetical protein L6V93_01980 [Clostridiales bacterium]